MNEDEKDFQEGTEKELESQETENTDIVSDVQDDDAQEDAPQEETSKRKGRVKVPPLNTDETRQFLSGMYQTWFLDYASYVNLERAVPNIMDGLKPVQRRILHSMKRLDDGRYN